MNSERSIDASLLRSFSRDTVRRDSTQSPSCHCIGPYAMENVPTGHIVQFADAFCENDPGAHAEQKVLPASVAYFPAMHSRQVSARPAATVWLAKPGWHARHAEA